MSDDDFLAQLESCTLSPDLFHHADHIRAAWLYLSRLPATDAIARFSESLRRYATSLGKPDRYHETITWAYLLLVNERIHGSRPAKTWQEFTAANADLFDWQNSVLFRYYRRETLASCVSRRVFVMPDRLEC